MSPVEALAALAELHGEVPDHGRFSGDYDCDKRCIHDPDETVCAVCRDYAGDPYGWPCPTVRIINTVVP